MSTTGEKIKLIIADDHELFRDGLKLMLSNVDTVDIIGEAENGRDLVSLAKKLSPNVIITDIKMPIIDGIEATRQISAFSPVIGIIALSMLDEDKLILEMLQAGALGFLVKNSDKVEIIDAIHSVSIFREYYCKHTSYKLAKIIGRYKPTMYKIKKEDIVFSSKEIEIILLICAEYTTKEIAEKLTSSTRTIESIRAHILDKLEVRNTVGLVIQAIRLGIYDPNVVLWETQSATQ